MSNHSSLFKIHTSNKDFEERCVNCKCWKWTARHGYGARHLACNPSWSARNFGIFRVVLSWMVSHQCHQAVIPICACFSNLGHIAQYSPPSQSAWYRKEVERNRKSSLWLVPSAKTKKHGVMYSVCQVWFLQGDSSSHWDVVELFFGYSKWVSVSHVIFASCFHYPTCTMVRVLCPKKKPGKTYELIPNL